MNAFPIVSHAVNPLKPPSSSTSTVNPLKLRAAELAAAGCVQVHSYGWHVTDGTKSHFVTYSEEVPYFYTCNCGSSGRCVASYAVTIFQKAEGKAIQARYIAGGLDSLLSYARHRMVTCSDAYQALCYRALIRAIQIQGQEVRSLA